ncbi:MAG: hypothetical protein U5L45_13990 [Saprospiraceae bacterium]|nr:hypothetical protein [Saprospiraceae bacterium]
MSKKRKGSPACCLATPSVFCATHAQHDLFSCMGGHLTVPKLQ